MSRIGSPFGIRTTATEVLDGVTLRGKRAIVTGASSGIGAETALALAKAGAAVTLAVRDRAAGQRVAASIVRGTGNDDVHVAALDLADRASIAAFTGSWRGPLHILIANAGLNLPDLRHTTEGVELTFAVCHLGPKLMSRMGWHPIPAHHHNFLIRQRPAGFAIENLHPQRCRLRASA